jgi:predicted transcriptional regulator
LQKENDDLKHDNTILYNKSLKNKERLDQLNAEVEEMKRFIENEKQRNFSLEGEVKRLSAKLQTVEDLLMVEKERGAAKDRVIEEMKQQYDGQMRDMEGQIAMRKQELDNIKRAYDEQHYEGENLRK